MEELMVFWLNSGGIHPVLCGTIDGWTEEGRAKVKEYGPGFSVKPLLILPKSAGVKKKDLLIKLEAEHRDAVNEMQNKFAKKLYDIIPEALQSGTASS